MHKYDDLLNHLLAQQQTIDDDFKPTHFWQTAVEALSEIIRHDQLPLFRAQSACLSYFVPTYGFPGIALSEEQISAILDTVETGNIRQKATISSFTAGKEHFFSDYRVLRAAEKHIPNALFSNFSESKIGSPLEHFEVEQCFYSRSALNYINGLLALLSFDPGASFNRVIEIGGGFGSLGEILFKTNFNTELYVDLDIPPTCIFADYYLKEVFGQEIVTGLAMRKNYDQSLETMKGIHVLPNWDVARLSGQIDLFVNFISFQEMEPDVVSRYIKEICRLSPTYLLLRNLREGKPIAQGNNIGVTNPVRGIDYENWLQDHYQLVVTDSAVFGYTTSDGFHSEITIWKHR